MYSARAVRLKVGPVIPGAAAKAAGASNSAVSTIARNSCVFEIALFMFISLIAALLIASIPEGVAACDAAANVHFGHQAAKILSVVGQVVEIGGVEIENAIGRILGGVA